MTNGSSGFYTVAKKDGQTSLRKDGKEVGTYQEPTPPRPRRVRAPIVADPSKFIGPKLKIERAKRHIADFQAMAQAFFEEQPYGLIADVDPQTGENIYRVLVKKQIPIELSALLGDAIHNLRTALDYAVTDMIKAADGEIKYNERFPIVGRRKALKPRGVSEVPFVGGPSNRLIRFLNRDKCASAGLWTLHWLDIMDKHHSIVPVTSATLQITAMVGAPGMFVAPNGELCIGGGPPGSKPYLVPAGTPTHFSPLILTKDNVEIHRSPGGFQEHVNVSFTIAFSQTKVVEAQPVVETLRQLAEFTERILNILERRAF